MWQVRRQVEAVSRPELDRLRAGCDPQKTLDDPARFGKRVRVLGHPCAREIRPPRGDHAFALERATQRDRKSTRLNSSHANISYAVFCLKKKKILENYKRRWGDDVSA